MKAYKLMIQRKDGSLGSLFINRSQHLVLGTTYEAEEHRTKGYAYRPGWHCLLIPEAPHLKINNNRVWVEVEIQNYTTEERSESQGGLWFLAGSMTPLRVL